MYTKILVPLDGSVLAESVLPYVKWFTEVSRVNELVFLRVVEPFSAREGLETKLTPEERKQIEQDAVSLAEGYLDGIAGNFKDSAGKISRVVNIGKLAKIVAEYVSQSDVDLIIMATHAFSGLHRWVRGSVADEILHAAKVPVFLVKQEDRPPDQPDSNN